MNSKAKGKRGELELAKILRSYGFQSRRGVQYKGSEDSPDVVGLPRIHIEVKRVQSLHLDEAIDQAVAECGHNIPAVFHRKNNRPWLVTMRLDDWMMLYQAWLKWEGVKDIL